MTIELAETIWLMVGLYVGIGLVFGLLFVVLGASRIDHAAQGVGVFFRLIVLPGVAGLWPLMVIRLLSMRKINAPIEDTPIEDTPIEEEDRSA